jgi:hypothetical protein
MTYNTYEMLALRSEVSRLRCALQRMVYETTHLSRQQDDGSHWCNISHDALTEARAALPAHRAVPVIN